ncbi:endothelin-converting enzyme 1-like [Amblyomma americanum]
MLVSQAALFKGTATPGSNILRTIVRGPAKSEHSRKEPKAPSPAKNSAPSTPPEAPSVRPAPTPSSTLRAFEGVVSFFGLRSKGISHVPTPQAEPAAKEEDQSVCLLPDEEMKEAKALWQSTCKLQDMMGPTTQTSQHGWQFYLKAHGAWLAFAIGAGLFVAFMLGLSMLARYRNAIVTAQKICRTEDCVIHERLLRQNINGSVDPCQDFSAYACSAWSPSKQFVSYAAATTSDAIEAWFKGFETLLSKGSQLRVTGRKALAMYRACMDAERMGSTDDTGMADLKEFMRERRIPWPGEPDARASPLGILLDLAFNWQTPFWFHVQVWPDHSGDRNVLMLRSGNFMMFWSNFHKSLMAERVYYNYYMSYFEAFAGVNESKPTEEEVAKTAAMESDILGRFMELLIRKNKTPADFSLSEVERLTPSINSSEWLSEIGLHVALWPDFGAGDHVLVEDTALLTTVDQLFAKYSRREVARHIAWFFVQVFAPLGNIELLKNKFGEFDRGISNRPVFCATEVEASYGVLIRLLFLEALFTTKARSIVDRTLEDITESARQRFATVALGSNSSSSNTSAAAKSKLDKLRVSLWPPDSLLKWRALSEMYSSFAPAQESLARYWVHGHERLRQLSEQPQYAQALAQRANFLMPLIRYDYLRNVVSVSVATLQRPLFYLYGTPAMTHGGLGFTFAKELVKALDSTGLMVDPSGRIDDSWVPAEWREHTAQRACCLPSGDDIFPEVPALRIAHDAFLRRRRREAGGTRVSLLWSDQQVFFITACFSMCGRRGSAGSLGGDCNKAVSNLSPFARAFHCPSGSPMNPKRRCTYFE